MKKLLVLSIALFLFIPSAYLSGQVEQEGKVPIPRNYLKFNLASAMIKNYSFQYERVLTRGMTFSVGYKLMPESGLPYCSKLEGILNEKSSGNNLQVEENINLESIRLKNYALTPELRFYMGKKRFGRGFYFSLFYRYSQYEAGKIEIPYEEIPEQEITLTAEGNIKAQTVGFMFGTQWAIGKHICLDWWMLGPHAGIAKADISVNTSTPLSEAVQQDIRDGLDEIDFPMLKKDITVSADGIRGKLDGPFGGIRAGLSLGIRF